MTPRLLRFTMSSVLCAGCSSLVRDVPQATDVGELRVIANAGAIYATEEHAILPTPSVSAHLGVASGAEISLEVMFVGAALGLKVEAIDDGDWILSGGGSLGWLVMPVHGSPPSLAGARAFVLAGVRFGERAMGTLTFDAVGLYTVSNSESDPCCATSVGGAAGVLFDLSDEVAVHPQIGAHLLTSPEGRLFRGEWVVEAGFGFAFGGEA